MAQQTFKLVLGAGVEDSQAAPVGAKVLHFWSEDILNPAKYKGTTTGATELLLTEGVVYGPFAVTEDDEVFFESVGTANVHIIFETGIRN